MTFARLVAALGLLLFGARAATAAPPALACFPDRPLAAAGQPVAVHAASEVAQPHFRWRAGSGRLTVAPDGATATWIPDRTAAAVSTITVEADAAECTVQIAVSAVPNRGGGEEILPSQTILPRDGAEAPGFGLYSYILVASRPQSAAERQWMDALLAAFLAYPDAETMTRLLHGSRSALNATYLPVTRPLPDDFDQRDDKLAVLRNRYDHERANALLLRLHALASGPLATANGAWIISCLRPLSDVDDPGCTLGQELTGVPERLVGPWVKRFLAVTSQPHRYGAGMMGDLALDLRLAIAQLGDGLPNVAGAFKLLAGG